MRECPRAVQHIGQIPQFFLQEGLLDFAAVGQLLVEHEGEDLVFCLHYGGEYTATVPDDPHMPFF